MPNSRKLPCELTVEALAAWIDSLRAMPQAQAAHQLNQLLKKIKDDMCEPSALLPVLLGLTPISLRYANGLATAATAPSEHKNFAASRKVAKLCMQLLRQLALLFCQLAEQENLANAERQTAIYYALQCVGHCLRVYCLFYETPSATLWKKSAALYELASSKQYLRTHQSTKLTEFRQQNDIETVLKRNLLFSILRPALHAPSEINQFFELANHYADQLQISTAPDGNDFGFYWDLNDEQPPCKVRKARRPLPHGFLAIDAQTIGLALQQDVHVAHLERLLQTKIALLLSNYQAVFDSIIPGHPSHSEFLLGFKDVSAFLLELNKLQKIRQLSGQAKASGNPRRNLALVPLEHEKNAFEWMNQAIAKTNAISKVGNVLKITHTEYTIAEGGVFDCFTGDLAMFYRDQQPATLAIIREQSSLSISNVTHILMEKIPGPYSIYTIQSGSNNQQAIVVDEEGKDPQVFLPPGKYAVDGKIPLTIEESLHLTACLESTSFFARFRFYFDS